MHLIHVFSRGRLQGIARWLPANPAEAKALPCEGASALMIHAMHAHKLSMIPGLHA